MNFFKKTVAAFREEPTPAPMVERFTIYSTQLEKEYIIDAYLTGNHRKCQKEKYPFVLFNDGQDLPRMDFENILKKRSEEPEITPCLIFGIHCNERRIKEYGTARQPDYKGRGHLAPAYTRFILEELLPHLRLRFPLSNAPESCGIAGFSLGGLSALDIAWAHPEVFGVAGVFSASLWWRSHDVREEDPDADRIMHDIVEKTTYPHPNQRFWFQCGTEDETEDRNHNGVIDSIDDTLDLIRALRAKGIPDQHIRYLEIEKGRHEPKTWGEAMPDFLRWNADRGTRI
jgi:enterochelin esterase-like enzyme